MKGLTKVPHNRYNGLLPLILVIIVFFYLTVYILPTNIHGDGKSHTLYAREIVDTGRLPEYEPYSALFAAGETTHLPIYYPLTSQTLMSLFYMIGGETAVKFSSPILGMLVALFVYLLLRPFSKYGAFAAALFTIILNSQRFIMVPLIEQLLLFGMVASLYFYYLLIKKRQKKYILLTGLFLGLVVATKQQGLVFFAVILAHAVFTGICRKARDGDFGLSKLVFPILIIAIVVSSCPLLDQLERNGVLIEEGNVKLPPFSTPKFPESPEASAAVEERIGYDIVYDSPLETLGAYLLHPFCYSSALGFLRDHAIFGSFLCFLVALLFLAGTRYLFRKDKLLLSLVSSVFLVEVLATYFTDTRPFQYHNIGLATLGIMLVFGLLATREWAKSANRIRLAAFAVLPLFVIGSFIGYVVVVHDGTWNDSGRYEDYYLEAYGEMGDFVSSNMPEEAVFLTGGGAGTAFQYYSRRQTSWITEWGGADIPLIFEADDEEEALYWLKYYNIDYIFIDVRQTSWLGLNDFIPPHGLLDYIDDSRHFKKVHASYANDEVLKLYEVIYNP